MTIFRFLDDNECLVNNGGCAHICDNEVGSFTCRCTDGYVLDVDNLSCNGEYAKRRVTVSA